MRKISQRKISQRKYLSSQSAFRAILLLFVWIFSFYKEAERIVVKKNGINGKICSLKNGINGENTQQKSGISGFYLIV